MTRFFPPALVLAVLGVVGGCGEGPLSNRDVCESVAGPECRWAERCGRHEVFGPPPRCPSVMVTGCCLEVDCDAPAAGSREDVDACTAALDRAVMDCSWEWVAACEGLLSERPPEEVDAGGTMLPDAGRGPVERYGTCRAHADCSTGGCYEVQGCFDASGRAGCTHSICTTACEGAGDRTSCAADEICVRAVDAYGATCMKACSGNLGCPDGLLCRLNAYAQRFCAP